jgi:Ni,Fe-hydrogenase I cytochrome b subunit
MFFIFFLIMILIVTGDVVYPQLTLKDLFQEIKGVVEKWSFVPHVVDELLKLDGRKK